MVVWAFCALLMFVTGIAASPEKPLRILMVVQQYPLYLETFVINEIKGLCDAGHEVHLLAHYKILRNAHHELESCLPEQKVYYQQLPQDTPPFDIMYAQFSHLALFALEQKKKGVAKKLVVNFRGGDQMLNTETLEEKKIHRFLAREVDCVVAVCESIKKRLLDAGYNAEKICVIPSGIRSEKFAFHARSLNVNQPIQILSVGRLVEQKGFEYALRAVAQVYKKHKNIRYTIAGSGVLHGTLQQLTQQLGIAHVATLVGQKNHQEIAHLLASSHLYLLPSVTAKDGRCEGIPDSLKEAMACGLPVISTRHSGIPELVEDGKSGFLVPERDVSALADRINYVIEHPASWPSLGMEGRAAIEKMHTYECAIKNLESLFKQLAL